MVRNVFIFAWKLCCVNATFMCLPRLDMNENIACENDTLSKVFTEVCIYFSFFYVNRRCECTGECVYFWVCFRINGTWEKFISCTNGYTNHTHSSDCKVPIRASFPLLTIVMHCHFKLLFFYSHHASSQPVHSERVLLSYDSWIEISIPWKKVGPYPSWDWAAGWWDYSFSDMY